MNLFLFWFVWISCITSLSGVAGCTFLRTFSQNWKCKTFKYSKSQRVLSLLYFWKLSDVWVFEGNALFLGSAPTLSTQFSIFNKTAADGNYSLCITSCVPENFSWKTPPVFRTCKYNKRTWHLTYHHFVTTLWHCGTSFFLLLYAQTSLSDASASIQTLKHQTSRPWQVHTRYTPHTLWICTC